MWSAASHAQRQGIQEQGYVSIPSEYGGTYPITRSLIEDGRHNLIMRTPYHASFPVRLLHGTDDQDVPQERALRLLAHLDCPDIRLVLLKGSDHRMSKDRELLLLKETLTALIYD